MKQVKIILGLGLIVALFSCEQGERGQLENKTFKSETDGNGYVSSTAAVENPKDTTRKFIRTADLKFRVKNVINSTYDIEEIAKRQNGFVTFTNLTSTIVDLKTTPISSDSSLESTYYKVSNSISLRIPNTKLDTTLKEISRNIDFLDYRVIKADDVALQIHANDLTQKRSAKNEERLTNAIDRRAKKLNETTIAEDVLLSKEEQSDNAKISNLSLSDQINFSTITLTIYQREDVRRELVANDKNITAFEPGFGSKLVEAFKFGWEVLESLLIVIARLWGFLLVGLIAYVVYKVYVKKLKK